MNLSNPIETIVHHLLIGGMTYGECTSVCDVHWTGPTMNHDARLSIVMIHQATRLHGLSTLRGY